MIRDVMFQDRPHLTTDTNLLFFLSDQALSLFTSYLTLLFTESLLTKWFRYSNVWCSDSHLTKKSQFSRLARTFQPVLSNPPTLIPAALARPRESFHIDVQHLTDRDGLKISLPQKLAKNPKRIARVFRDKNVLELIKLHSCKSSSQLTLKGKRKRASKDATFTFTICPVIDGEGNFTSRKWNVTTLIKQGSNF